jgi:hypothetical protein
VTAWLTWEDSNFHIPISKNAFEMSAEFPLFWPKTQFGDFCSCKLWKGADAETVKTPECVPYIGYVWALEKVQLGWNAFSLSRNNPQI